MLIGCCSALVLWCRAGKRMSKRRTDAPSGGSAAKKPAPNRHVDNSGDGGRGGVDTKAAASMWLPTASELKPALDGLRPETGLLPELNGVVAAFADLDPVRWTPNPLVSWHHRLAASIGQVPRRLRMRVLGPSAVGLRYWLHLRHEFTGVGTTLLTCERADIVGPFTACVAPNETPAHGIDLADAVLELSIAPTGPQSGVLTARIGSLVIATVARDDLALCHLFRSPHEGVFVFE